MVSCLMSLMFLLYASLYYDVVRATCTEPTIDELQSKFENLNNRLNFKSLFMPEGWNTTTLDSKFNELYQLTSAYRMSATCPSRYITASALMLRSSCPWFITTDYDMNRYPKLVFKAGTHCTSRCIAADGGQKCEGIYRPIKVLMRTNACNNDVYQYREHITYLPIAFICAEPPKKFQVNKK